MVKPSITFWFAGFLLMLVLCFLFYRPGLSSYFYLDDSTHIVNNENIKIDSLDIDQFKKVLESKSSSQIGRPLSMLSLAADFHFYGLDAKSFKVTNLLLHVFCGFLLWVLIWRLLKLVVVEDNDSWSLTNPVLISGLCALMWVLHPLHVSTVLYPVQRMAIFSTISILLFLHLYLWMSYGNAKSVIATVAGLVGLAFILVVGVLFKENAVLAVPLALVCDAFIRFKAGKIFELKGFRAGFGIFFVIVPISLVFYGAFVSQTLSVPTYEIRDFTLVERLLTEARVLVVYAKWIMVPFSDWYGLFHDDFPKSQSLIEPPTSALAVVFWSVSILCCFFYRRKFPIAFFLIGFFLVGHMLESTILPLELVFEHRNYLPSMSLFIAVAIFVVMAGRKRDQRINSRLALCLVLWCCWSCLQLGLRTFQWGDPERQFSLAVQNHPESSRAHVELARVHYSKILLGDHNKYYHHYVAHALQAVKLNQRDFTGYFALIGGHLSLGIPYKTDWLLEFVAALDEYPFYAGSWQNILQLLMCVDSGNCPPDQNLQMIVDAVINSPVNSASAKARISRYYAIHLHNQDEYQLALNYFKKSMELKPTAAAMGDLISYYVFINEATKAQQVYKSGVDTYGAGFVEEYGYLEEHVLECCDDKTNLELRY